MIAPLSNEVGSGLLFFRVRVVGNVLVRLSHGGKSEDWGDAFHR